MAKKSNVGGINTPTPSISKDIQKRANKSGTSSGTNLSGKCLTGTRLQNEGVQSFMSTIKKMKP